MIDIDTIMQDIEDHVGDVKLGVMKMCALTMERPPEPPGRRRPFASLHPDSPNALYRPGTAWRACCSTTTTTC